MNGKRISRSLKSSFQLFWTKYGGALVALSLFGILIFLLFNLNIFYVQNFIVTSFDEEELVYIDDEEVQDSLIEYIGQRLFQLDVNEVESTVLESFTFVMEVYVSKRVPNSVTVKIVERIPTLTIKFEKVDYLIDDDGIVLCTCEDYSDACEGIPSVVVTGYKREIEIGQKPFITEIDEVVEIASLETDVGVKMTEFLVPTEDVISVTFEDSTRAIFSTEKQISDQIETYSYTRENLLLKNESFKEIDLRYDRPVIRVDKYTY